MRLPRESDNPPASLVDWRRGRSITSAAEAAGLTITHPRDIKVAPGAVTRPYQRYACETQRGSETEQVLNLAKVPIKS
jgi:hypothetical protein